MADLNADRPNQYPWPPIIYCAVLAVALILDQLAPWWPNLDWLGWIFCLGGLAIGLIGFNFFQQIGATFDPTGPATVLATGGIYQYTRNPMYLGAMIFFFGLALGQRSGWLLVLVPVVVFALEKLAIEPEEAYLTRRFGDDYRAYCTKVRRWV